MHYLILSFFIFPLMAHSLTLEEKVGQLLLVHFHGQDANEDAKILIQEAKVSGFVYYDWSNQLGDKKHVRALSTHLQALASIPLFIGIDEEGGRYSRLHKDFTLIPGNEKVAATNNPEMAKKNALIKGAELRTVGINLNFAPVVDIACNRKNFGMRDRCFGSTPEKVIAFAEKALEGYKQAGIIATLKHFPGHGDVEGDSHFSLPLLNKSLSELETMELAPYASLSAKTEAIMTGHLFVPAFDNENCSTFSKKTLDYLKNTLNFKGVIISDSLAMEGARQNHNTVEEAALAAFNAGCDLLLLAGKAGNFELSVSDIQKIHAYLVEAVHSGRISENRLDESVIKILNLKQAYL